MMSFEDIEKYLPKYLSPQSEKLLFEELRAFPSNIDSRFYSRALEANETIYQGDGLTDMLFIRLPDRDVNPVPAMVISNTCDMDPENRRLFHGSICYAAIVNLNKYQEMLRRNGVRDEISLNDHIENIRRQRVTQIFYLPQGARLEYEGLVFLDRICHCTNTSVDRSDVPHRRLFALSDYGAYLFALKLSIHFTRLTDGVDRMAS